MLKSYIKLALKVWMRRKFITFVSLFGIAFTLVVLMTVMALFDHVLRPRGPEKNLDRILTVDRFVLVTPNRQGYTSRHPGYGFLNRYVRNMATPQRVSFFSSPQKSIGFIDGVKVTPELRRTDVEYWRILDFDFLEGGPYSANDVERGNMVAVINETMKRKFFGKEAAVGKNITVAVRGVKAGATDFITKPWDNNQLLRAVETAICLSQTEPKIDLSREELDERYDFSRIVGKDSALVSILERAGQVAPTDAPVLILGESGTGKELVAEAIHANSSRSEKPFVKVNLGGLATTFF